MGGARLDQERSYRYKTCFDHKGESEYCWANWLQEGVWWRWI